MLSPYLKCLGFKESSIFSKTLYSHFSSSHNSDSSFVSRRSNRYESVDNGQVPRIQNYELGDGYPKKQYLRSMNPIYEQDSPVGRQQNGISVNSGFPIGIHRDWRFDNSTVQDMDISFLGTASCIPSINRGVSCLALRLGGASWLFDCGESTLIQLQRSRITPASVKKIFISHMHGDHLFGLPAVLCMLGQAAAAGTERLSESFEVVDIYGPEGIRDYVRATTQLTHSKIVIPHRIHELKDLPCMSHRRHRVPNMRTSPGTAEVDSGHDYYPNTKGYFDLVTTGDLTVKAASMVHSVPCVGFVVEEKMRLGRLKSETVIPLFAKNEKAFKEVLGIQQPVKILQKIKNMRPDESFTFPDGTVLSAEDAVEPSQKGRKICIMGDTRSGEFIADIAAGSDILVHEATNAYLSNTASVGSRELERDTWERGHSTPQMAGSFAAQIGARQLLLTHFSARYLGDPSESSMRTMWQIEDLARHTSGLTGANDVVAAWDMMRIDVYRPKRGNVSKPS